MLRLIGSGNPKNIDAFFASHEATRGVPVSRELKALFAKMLAINPADRVPLHQIITNDEWVRNGPRNSPL
jgi:hypothetical protein